MNSGERPKRNLTPPAGPLSSAGPILFHGNITANSSNITTTYDANGNVLKVTNPVGNVTHLCLRRPQSPHHHH